MCWGNSLILFTHLFMLVLPDFCSRRANRSSFSCQFCCSRFWACGNSGPVIGLLPPLARDCHSYTSCSTCATRSGKVGPFLDRGICFGSCSLLVFRRVFFPGPAAHSFGSCGG